MKGTSSQSNRRGVSPPTEGYESFLVPFIFNTKTMQNYDKLTYIILNRILMGFGMRIKEGKKVVFIYKVKDYTKDKVHAQMKVIELSDDISSVFTFLKMDYKKYKETKFERIFEYVTYVTDNCPFFTRSIVKYLREELDKESFEEDEELKKQVLRFVRTIVISHAVLREFNFTPLVMYSNLREAVVRYHFDSDSVTNQIVNAKLELRNDKDLIGKFSGLKVVNWIHQLRKDSKLTGIFIHAFVNYVTKNDPKNFPKFLIDNEPTIIKKEVLTFYYQMFLLSEEYQLYLIEGVDEDNIIRS
jgi:hypothetical protein